MVQQIVDDRPALGIRLAALPVAVAAVVLVDLFGRETPWLIAAVWIATGPSLFYLFKRGVWLPPRWLCKILYWQVDRPPKPAEFRRSGDLYGIAHVMWNVMRFAVPLGLSLLGMTIVGWLLAAIAMIGTLAELAGRRLVTPPAKN